MPDVPRLMVHTPGVTLPVPMAPIMLSPPPEETRTSLKPKAAAVPTFIGPMGSMES